MTDLDGLALALIRIRELDAELVAAKEELRLEREWRQNAEAYAKFMESLRSYEDRK